MVQTTWKGHIIYFWGASDRKTRRDAKANRKVFDQCPRKPYSDDSEQSDPETASDSDSVVDSSVWDTDSDPEMHLDSYDDLTSGCTCGASGRAHSRDCPLNPRSKSGNRSSNPGLGREGQSTKPSRPPLNQRKRSRKRREPLFQPGSYVAVHRAPLKEKHICCRVIECLEKSVAYTYRLSCLNGVITVIVSEKNLRACTSARRIPLDSWRTTMRVSLKVPQSDSRNIEECSCEGYEAKEVVDLTDSAQSLPPPRKTGRVWIRNSLYILQDSDRRIIASPSGWLNDNIIDASQKLLAQHFPLTHGLEPPTLERIDGFQSHSGEFLQILNTGSNHWILVSSIGCEDGAVNVYDTFHTELQELPDSTIRTISRLIVTSSPQLTLKMIEVDRQKNSDDCGVLAVAIAFDLLSASTPCIAAYDIKRNRAHLIECLARSKFSPFPVIGERSTSDISCLDVIELDLHCVCRLPELPGDKMAECESCKQWFHSHCVDIPNSVFNSEADVRWLCRDCQSVSVFYCHFHSVFLSCSPNVSVNYFGEIPLANIFSWLVRAINE